MRLGGIDYTEKSLDFVGTQVAEEINVKSVAFALDIENIDTPSLTDVKMFIVEHDPIRKTHRSYLKTVKEMTATELHGWLIVKGEVKE